MKQVWEGLRAELVEIIEWSDAIAGAPSPAGDTLAWRFHRDGDPGRSRTIPNGAQLVMREGHWAVFLDEGRIADAFGPGRHRLSTANLPLLTSLLCLPGTVAAAGPLERLVAQGGASALQIDHRLLETLSETPRTGSTTAWRYRRCPSCGELMKRTLHGKRSGVVVDRCRDHGLWRDAGELRQLLEWPWAGGALLVLERSHQEAQEQANRQEVERRESQRFLAEAKAESELPLLESPARDDLGTLVLRLTRRLGGRETPLSAGRTGLAPERGYRRGNLQSRHFDLDVKTVAKPQFAIIGGKSISVHIFAGNIADSYPHQCSQPSVMNTTSTIHWAAKPSASLDVPIPCVKGSGFHRTAP